MSAITPAVMKKALSICSNGSSPGPDKISYFHLKNLPSTHHFLATLFSKIILPCHKAPSSWCVGNLILIYKKGDITCPSNFCPIALTSTVGKLFHCILANRLERYLLQNGYINPNLQKGFISGVDGVLENILSLNSILNISNCHNLPLFMTFIDLRNAFGSIHHSLINDVLHTVNLPPIILYITNLYSKLSASIITRQWSTPSFKISRGVFQGFKLKLPLNRTDGFPPVNSCIYVEWQEETSTEPAGWYHCTVVEYNSDSRAVLKYREPYIGISQTLSFAAMWEQELPQSCSVPLSCIGPRINDQLSNGRYDQMKLSTTGQV
uniref:Reverse transcriptase domain-containing protein n=1 Tax=Amphimedon queenslandica TaxID=400682 RepID=A0A1X7V0K1_AMPQE